MVLMHNDTPARLRDRLQEGVFVQGIQDAQIDYFHIGAVLLLDTLGGLQGKLEV